MGQNISDYYPAPPDTFKYLGRFVAFRFVFHPGMRSSEEAALHVNETLSVDPRIESHLVSHFVHRLNDLRIVEVTVRFKSHINWLHGTEYVSP